jgi:uncharacterized protein (TIGR00730 family)
MKTINIFLGANSGTCKDLQREVVKLGEAIAKQNLTLIYGGSSLGLMGLLSNTVKNHHGKVIGVTTQHLLSKEQALENLDELHVLSSMVARKKMMRELAHAFIVMPGGLGTLEEAFETWNAIKLGEITKPIGFCNIDGFFDPLFGFINSCKKSGFISEQQANIPIVNTSAVSIVETFVRNSDARD